MCPRRATARSKCIHHSRSYWDLREIDSNMNNRIEVAVKQILSGMEIKTNASVANPEALDWFKQWAKTH